MIRIKIICSDANHLKTRLNSLSDWLVNRCYKQEVIMKEVYRVDAIEHESLFVKHPKQNKIETLTLREKCPYLRFFWPVFSPIRTE